MKKLINLTMKKLLIIITSLFCLNIVAQTTYNVSGNAFLDDVLPLNKREQLNNAF